MMDAADRPGMTGEEDVKQKLVRLRSALEANLNTPWWMYVLTDCVESLFTSVCLVGTLQEENKRLRERCDSLEKRYSELLYKVTSLKNDR